MQPGVILATILGGISISGIAAQRVKRLLIGPPSLVLAFGLFATFTGFLQLLGKATRTAPQAIQSSALVLDRLAIFSLAQGALGIAHRAFRIGQAFFALSPQFF